MREEKKYLSESVAKHLKKSDYVFLADYAKVTVVDIAELRANLAKHDAEFHVVKNSAFHAATKQTLRPDFSEYLNGQVAIVVGGKNPSGAAKVLVDFRKKSEKCSFKAGALGDRVLTGKEIEELSKLPSLEVLRAQLLGLLNTPAQQLLRVCQGVPQGLLNVLDAYSKKG